MQEPHNYLIPVFSQGIDCKDDKNIPLILMHNGLPALAAGISLAFGSTPASLSLAEASIAAGGVSLLAGPGGWAIGAAALESYALYTLFDKGHKEQLFLEMSTDENSNDSSTDKEQPKEDKDKALSDEAIDKILKGANPGRETMGSTKQFEKPGVFEDALKNFDKIGVKDTKDIVNGEKIVKIGKLPDGRTVNVRNKSQDSRPTLEIYDGKKSIKIRYEPK